MAPVGVCGALLHTGLCWMYGWLSVAEKTHLRRATFCFFCLTTLRVILTDDLCVRRTWKIKPEKELEQDFSIFSDRWQVSSAGLRTTWQNNVQYCRLACTVTRTAVVGGKRRLRLGFVLPTEKGSTPSVLAVLVLCLRLFTELLSPSRPPRICLTCRIRYMCSVLGNCSWCSALHQTTRLSNLTKRKSPWRLKTHWDPCDCSATPCIEISSVFPKYRRQTPGSTVTGCRQTQVSRVLSDLYPIS